MDLLLEIGIILALVLANGVFALAEISLVSSRRSRLRQLADSGDAKAAAALALAESPSRFLATVQIGITLVGIVAGAFGGARLSGRLSVYLEPLPWIGAWAQELTFTAVVLFITYLSLILGELIPKRLGLSNPEGFARSLAYPMSLLSRIAGPVVTFLGASTEGAIRLFGLKLAGQSAVTDEEVKALMKEGLQTGNFVQTESSMVENILELDHLVARELMTPRTKIIWIEQEESHEQIWHKIVVSGHSTFPVYAKSRDHVVGLISVKSIYANLAAGAPVRVSDLMTAPLLLPAVTPASKVLDTFKSSGKHFALLVDEYGHVVGLVTVHDLLEAIVGEMPSMEDRLKPAAVQRHDGSWLIDALLDCETFEATVQDFKLHPAAERDYQTVAGYIIQRLNHVPMEGDYFDEQGYRVEIIDLDGHRVDKILMIPVPALTAAPIADETPS
jgi:putative hemolysin